MMKPRVMPILASTAIALSLAACAGAGGESSQQTSSTAYPSSQPGAASQTQAQAQVQAVSPDLVRNVQRTLSQRGYNAGPADGVYGESTQQALRNFQRDQRLNSSGQLDSQTLAALGVAQQGARSATGPASQEYTPTSRRGASAEPPRSSSSRQMASASGLSSTQVRELQQELSGRGYDPGQVDGEWGPRTQQALRQFQQDQNLAADGRPDQRTLAALGIEGAGTQTGAAPDERPRSQPQEAQPSTQRDDEMQRQENSESLRDREETGQLPETEAPGTVPESERLGGSERGFPEPERGGTPAAPNVEEPIPPGAR